MISLFHTLISTPFYNGFIFLIDRLPFLDIGIVVVLFTVIVKIVMLPLSIKASKAQLAMKDTQKDMQVIKDKYKDNKEEQSRKMIEYYKEKGINPFAGIFILLIQLPILIGLYQVFIKSGLPSINTDLLYSFVGVPESINMVFLGMVNILDKSVLLALLAGITTYFQVKYSAHMNPPAGEKDSQTEFARAMAMQMKYFFPVIMVFIAYSISSAIAIYFITSNIFAIAQEIYISKKYHQKVSVV